ncbi:PucR family transcriptional regulator [Oceanobacillus sp. FSL H7-0719]|uniref:PucR family transcriptional regulator n=1 Tax=Oceanobacillus sp. FSL H7-0719 TaxID=2954507 RepID=UPI0032484DA4
MKNKLKTIFPSLIFFSENDANYPEGYILYMTDDKQIIGIQENEVSKRDEVILTSLLTPYHSELPTLTKQEKLWMHHLNMDESSDENFPNFRLVYFTFPTKQLKPALFKEAIETLFDKPVPILWENESSGIIIEELENQADEPLSYEQIIDVLMSDLYVHIQFLVGPFIHTHADLKINYNSLRKHANTIFTYFEKQVVFYTEAILALLINQASSEFRENAIHYILKEVKEDKDLLHTVKVFFQSNLNASLTAKELYLHRNSLQYRLDKFIEKTGIDIRSFDQAALVYFILLAKAHEG